MSGLALKVGLPVVSIVLAGAGLAQVLGIENQRRQNFWSIQLL